MGIEIALASGADALVLEDLLRRRRRDRRRVCRPSFPGCRCSSDGAAGRAPRTRRDADPAGHPARWRRRKRWAESLGPRAASRRTGAALSFGSASALSVCPDGPHRNSALPDGRVLLLGGLSTATPEGLSSFVATPEVYDPATNDARRRRAGACRAADRALQPPARTQRTALPLRVRRPHPGRLWRPRHVQDVRHPRIPARRGDRYAGDADSLWRRRRPGPSRRPDSDRAPVQPGRSGLDPLRTRTRRQSARLRLRARPRTRHPAPITPSTSARARRPSPSRPARPPTASGSRPASLYWRAAPTPLARRSRR